MSRTRLPSPTQVPEPGGPEDANLRAHLLRAVNVALTATFLAVAVLIVYPPMAHESITNTPLYWATLATALFGAVGIGALPWPDILTRHWRFRALTLWSALDIVLVTLIVASTGGARSPMFIVYVLTTVFFAASYPGGAQFLLLAFTYACYLLVALPTADGDYSTIILRLAMLGITTYMVNFLSRRLMDEMTAHDRERQLAARRADLITTVASAGRQLSRLDEEHVLRVVTESAIALGFEAADTCVLADDGEHYEVVAAVGLPQAYTGSRHPAGEGVVGVVLSTGETAIVHDYEHLESAPESLRGSGFKTVIATPIRVGDRVVAALGAGSHRQEEITDQDIEAFELLATQAGRALDNARRFAKERETVERLEHLDELKSDFLSNVSHELRTPLTIIRGMSGTLRRRWDDTEDDQRRDLVHRIDANAVALEDVLTALLDFSLLQAGTIRTDPNAFDLGSLASETAERLTALLASHRFEHTISGEAVVYADRILLTRAVENLLTNAVKHTPPGSTVRLQVTALAGSVTVCVVDDGPGIPAAELAHVRDRFFRGGDANRRTTRGLGLGLALTHEILQLHGSALEVISEPGRGAEFRFELPLVTTEGIGRKSASAQ